MNHSLPKQIGDYNKNQMLSILRERGPTSRVELSRLLGLSPTAVTRNTSRLLQIGIIRECGAEQSDMGRKPILMELCADFCYVLGADIVGGVIKVALANLMGRIVRYYEEPVHLALGARAVLEQLLAALTNIIADADLPKEKIWAATIGTSGFFDPDAGKSRLAFFLDGWEDIDIRKEVFDSISVDALIENDVNLDVIGESWKGVGKDYENILYVKLGQGLAARIVLQNKLIRGEHNIAGEIGYMLPGLLNDKTVNYEHMLCNSSVARQYREMGGVNKANTISDINTLAEGGDMKALTVMRSLLDQFATVLLNSATVLDPEVIILGGDASSFREHEIALLKQRIEQHFPQVQNIIPSMLDRKACLYGAVKTGLDRVEERIAGIW